MEGGGTTEIKAMIANAEEEYSFRRTRMSMKSDLVRISRAEGRESHSEWLIDGRWLPVEEPAGGWSDLKDDDELLRRVRRYILPDLKAKAEDQPPDRPLAKSIARLRRWAWPPLQAGAAQHPKKEWTDRARAAFLEDLADVDGDELLEVRDQITSGYESNVRRIARAEDRASLFLGASVLTSSLVLANAGLLLGTGGRLDSPYRQIGAAALAVAGVFSVLAAFRALQATLSTFDRVTASNATTVFERRNEERFELIRMHVAALFVATHRAGTIADWKVARMKEARWSIVATIFSIAFLTVVVLVDAAF